MTPGLEEQDGRAATATGPAGGGRGFRHFGRGCYHQVATAPTAIGDGPATDREDSIIEKPASTADRMWLAAAAAGSLKIFIHWRSCQDAEVVP